MKFIIYIDDSLVNAVKEDYDLLSDELAAGYALQERDSWSRDGEVKILEKLQSSTQTANKEGV